MLAALVLAGIIAAPIGTACLLVRARRPIRTAGIWPSIRRFGFAIGGTAVLALVVVVALRLLGDSQHYAIDGAAGLAVASLVWLPVTRRWNARGHLCWSSTIFLFVVYLAFVLQWTFDISPRRRQYGRRPAAVAARVVRRDPGLRLPVGDLRRAGIRALAPAAEPA